MKKALALLGIIAASTASSSGTLYVGTEMTPNSAPLWRDSSGNFYDGNQLHTLCIAQNSFCSGYVAGIADVLQNQNANNLCIPKNATVGQITDVVKKYLTDHPEMRHFSGFSIVFVALETAFPCAVK
jgi:Rap1a immunity proteins